ncbi:MAG: LytTR family transcriptional regulator DNA-binding domain-containing protein [Flavipsychrobacter sp.]|nr:LytTR family transcriptional regulator DNA-binding domain-containing protein [Flavipsychrobacter sp.]
MKETRIAIVEDELIIADSIRSVLVRMNYQVAEPCINYNEAIRMLQSNPPHLLLLDINLGSHSPSGIEVGRYIRQHMNLPFIFLTANSDMKTVEEAKTVRPNAFLVKPFAPDELQAAIEIAMHNFYAQQGPVQPGSGKDFLFVKDGTELHKLHFSEILYLESDHVYVSLHTATRRYLVRTSLQNYIEQLDKDLFLRIHRSYVVNLSKIDKVLGSQVQIGSRNLPVSKSYRDALLSRL